MQCIEAKTMCVQLYYRNGVAIVTITLLWDWREVQVDKKGEKVSNSSKNLVLEHNKVLS